MAGRVMSSRGASVAATLGVLGLVGVAWVADTMGATLAVAREDYVTGKGSNRDFPSIDVVVRGGPHGEHPRTSGSITFGGVRYSLSSVSCFIVSGHTATWAGRLTPNPNFKYGKVTAVDGAGKTRDRFTAVGGAAPTGCETPASGFGGRLRSGDIVVHDALPAPTSPYPAGRRLIDVSPRPVALTRYGTVRARLTCLRSRRACRGRAVVLTGHGRRSWMAPFWIGPGRRAAVAVGLHRDQIRALRRHGQLGARIAAVRDHRTVGDAELTLVAGR
jgi:hypothetical protein